MVHYLFLRTTSESPIVWPGCDNFNFVHCSNCQDFNVNNGPTAVPNPLIQSQSSKFFNVKRTYFRCVGNILETVKKKKNVTIGNRTTIV